MYEKMVFIYRHISMHGCDAIKVDPYRIMYLRLGHLISFLSSFHLLLLLTISSLWGEIFRVSNEAGMSKSVRRFISLQ